MTDISQVELELIKLRLTVAYKEAYNANNSIANSETELPDWRIFTILGALARGYTTESNSHKKLDADLCMAMAEEIFAILPGLR